MWLAYFFTVPDPRRVVVNANVGDPNGLTLTQLSYIETGEVTTYFLIAVNSRSAPVEGMKSRMQQGNCHL